jgi:hypothetical protein
MSSSSQGSSLGIRFGARSWRESTSLSASESTARMLRARDILQRRVLDLVGASQGRERDLHRVGPMRFCIAQAAKKAISGEGRAAASRASGSPRSSTAGAKPRLDPSAPSRCHPVRPTPPRWRRGDHQHVAHRPCLRVRYAASSGHIVRFSSSIWSCTSSASQRPDVTVDEQRVGAQLQRVDQVRRRVGDHEARPQAHPARGARSSASRPRRVIGQHGDHPLVRGARHAMLQSARRARILGLEITRELAPRGGENGVARGGEGVATSPPPGARCFVARPPRRDRRRAVLLAGLRHDVWRLARGRRGARGAARARGAAAGP